MVLYSLTHWGRVTHICISKLNTIASDNGLSPDRRQAIIWINAEILLIGPSGTNFSEISIEILTFSFKKIAFEKVVCKTVSILSRPQWVNIWHILTRKQSEMQGCMICIVATDAMVLKHKAISNHSAASVLDRYFISNKSTYAYRYTVFISGTALYCPRFIQKYYIYCQQHMKVKIFGTDPNIILPSWVKDMNFTSTGAKHFIIWFWKFKKNC